MNFLCVSRVAFFSTTAKMSAPRLITASEILVERAALRKELGSVPHGTGCGWASMLWVSCDCPACRDEYDPTGEESAKYLNMDSTSFFRGQSEIPVFLFSKIAKESFLAAAGPGLYLKEQRLELGELIAQLPSVAKPVVLRISEDGWDEFILSEDRTTWTRRSYRKGRSVWYNEGENPPLPYEAMSQF